MGDITHFLDDVTRFSPIQKNGPDRYMELGPYLVYWHDDDQEHFRME